ncbi:hypothetical protein AVEN_199910-1 [Araneus ventricosus]|uniref:Uncharacterized protein n=1 Tax=Araneus ventricosus TaxID=182803 RepID=A0A4Y2S2S4_ARAVE|nr:hypothetical protein AVEN_199910-1 [Araneus ventricosus]
MSSLNSSSYSLQAPVLAVLQQYPHGIQMDFHPHILCLQQQQQTIQFPELKVSSITNVPLPGIRPPSGAMGTKNYLFTVTVKNVSKLPSSYRPISLLSNIGKLYEKLLLKQIIEHCNNQNIIPNEQFGFGERHSYTHQLLRVINKIVDGFNVKHYTGGVFFGCKECFRSYVVSRLDFQTDHLQIS